MLTEKVLNNIAVAWIEEAMDAHDEFRGAQVILAGEDAPVPTAAQKAGETGSGGSSLFFTVDITNDKSTHAQPLVCNGVDEAGRIVKTSSIIREIAFSISAYRGCAFDAAKCLQKTLYGNNMTQIFFAPHGLTLARFEEIAKLRELVHEQWEDRAQFGVYFRYVDSQIDCLDTIKSACVNETEMACAGAEPLDCAS